jgi:hypothetical protein
LTLDSSSSSTFFADRNSSRALGATRSMWTRSACS